jgi:23S rRNA (cytosine1962-C5)-methyltransferase
VQIVERRGAGVDHPVLLHLRETRYLKCYVLKVLA